MRCGACDAEVSEWAARCAACGTSTDDALPDPPGRAPARAVRDGTAALKVALLAGVAVVLMAVTAGDPHRPGAAPPTTFATATSPTTVTIPASRGDGVTLVFGGGALRVHRLGAPGAAVTYPDVASPGYPNHPIATGSAVVFIDKGEAYAMGRPRGFTPLGPAGSAFPSAYPGRVWIVRGGVDGQQAQELSVDGAAAGQAWSLPAGTTAVADAGEGLMLLDEDHTLQLWEPAARSTLATFGPIAYFIDTRGPRLAFTRSVCGGDSDCDLHIADLRDGNERAIKAPAGYAGFLGGGAISPDGSTLAAFVARADLRNLTADLVLIDVNTGRLSGPLPGSEIRYGEPVGSAVWSQSGNWLFFCGLGGPMHAVRPADAKTFTLDEQSSYSFAASDSILTP